MGLVDKVSTTGGLITSAVAMTGAYNLAGLVCQSSKYSKITQKAITVGLLSLAGIGGYKIGSHVIKKIHKDFSRAKTLAEISKDEDFQKRQGIEKGEFGIIRKGLKYLITTPLGGALGFIPGHVGNIPLCVYFGANYKWSHNAALNSGEIAGAIMGAYAFAKMTSTKNYQKLTTTAATLGGISIAQLINERILDLKMVSSKPDMFTGLGICASAAIATGTLGNLLYKYLDNTPKIKSKI